MKQKGEVMCQSDSYISKFTDIILYIQFAILGIIILGITFILNRYSETCERLARIEAKANIEPICEGSKKGE